MASRDYIKVATDQSAATKAQMLLSFKNAVAAVLQQGPPLLQIMNHNFDDSNPQAIVWTDLETLFGLPVGKGQAVFDMINGTMGVLQGTMQNAQAVNLISRVG